MSDSAQTPPGPQPPEDAENPRRLTFARAAVGVGVLVLATGLLQLAWAILALRPETAESARVSLESNLLFDQGAMSAVSGGVLAIGASYVGRTEQRIRNAETPSDRRRDPGWQKSLLALAGLLILGVIVLSVLPTPSEAIAYAPRDFDPLAPPTNLTTYGAYYVARPRLGFWGDRGSVVNVDVQITWTDNHTGAILFGGAPGNFTAYVASASSPRESPQIASTFVAPSSRFYVLVVWVGRCPTQATGECANTTLALQGQLQATIPTLYLPAQVGGSIFSNALVAGSAVGSRARSRAARLHHE